MNDFADDVPSPEGPPGQPPEPPRTSPPEVDGDPHAGHDPDGEELVFLERSLADLDAEKSAGDISEDDYRSLSGLYAERVAAVRRRHGGRSAGRNAGEGNPRRGRRLMAVHGGRSAGRNAGEGNPRRGRRLMAVLVTVAMLGTGVGVGLASALGHRSSVDTTTGDIRQSTRGMLFEAQEHMAAGRWAEAEALYAAVLAAQPSSAEALAWWGWLDLLRGDLESADERLAAAVAADPLYPDARVFGAVVTLRLGRDTAADRRRRRSWWSLTSPPASPRPRWRATRGLDIREMAAAARHLADGGQVVLAARLFGAALEADPTNVSALVGRGALLTSPDFAAFEDLLGEGLAALDRAVELAPDDPEARFWRAPAARQRPGRPRPPGDTRRARRPPDRGSPPRGGDPRRRRPPDSGIVGSSPPGHHNPPELPHVEIHVGTTVLPPSPSGRGGARRLAAFRIGRCNPFRV